MIQMIWEREYLDKRITEIENFMKRIDKNSENYFIAKECLELYKFVSRILKKI